MDIQNIYEVNYMSSEFSYVGTFRNQKKFDLNDNVFFAYDGHKIARGKIIGIELTIDLNPEYIYKVLLDKHFVTDSGFKDEFDYEHIKETTYNLTCKRIFTSLSEAKKSAFNNLETMYKLQKDQIERYFAQFNVF